MDTYDYRNILEAFKLHFNTLRSSTVLQLYNSFKNSLNTILSDSNHTYQKNLKHYIKERMESRDNSECDS